MGTGAATPPEPPGRQSAKLDIEKLAGFRLDYLISNAISLVFTRPDEDFPYRPAGRRHLVFAEGKIPVWRAVRSVAIVRSRQREDKTIFDFVEDDH